MDIDVFTFIAENIRGDRFRLSPVIINDGLAYHANLIGTSVINK